MATTPKSAAQKAAAKTAAKPAAPKTASAKEATGQKAAAPNGASKSTMPSPADAKKRAAKATNKAPAPPAPAQPVAKSEAKPRPAVKAPTKSVAKPAKAMKAPAAKTGKASTSKTVAKTAAVHKAEKTAAAATRSRYWAGAQRRARKLLKSKDELLAIARQGDKVAAKIKSGPMSRVIDQLKAVLRLIRAYATGEYKDVSWESMVLVVAAVLYVVSPIDLIPDFIPAIGYLDDVTVVSFALKIVREELDEFKAWERHTGRAPKLRRSSD